MNFSLKDLGIKGCITLTALYNYQNGKVIQLISYN